MDNEAKINIGFLIIFLGLLVVLMVYPFIKAAATDVSSYNLTIGTTSFGTPTLGFTINEDTIYNFNFTVNHTAPNIVGLNLTQINVTLPANFTFVSGTNGTGNISTVDGYASSTTQYFANYSQQLLRYNTTAATNNIITVNATAGTSGGKNGTFFWFNASGGTPGKYNITIRFNYNQTQTLYNETNITVTVNDTTIPYLVNVTESNAFGLNRSFANVSGTIVVNVSAIDNGNLTAGAREYDVQTVNISFFNGSDFNYSSLASNVTGVFWNISVNTKTLNDGVYNITVYVNDTLNNVNKTNVSLNVRVDNTKPTGSISCTPGTANVGNTVTCSCSPSDSTSGVNTTATTVTANPSTANTGTFTEKCNFADMAGNTATASTTYTVELSTTGTGTGTNAGGGGGAEAEAVLFYTKTIPVVAQEFKVIETITQQLGAKERVKVKINETIHYIGVREITLTTAIIEIASEAVQIELKAGEETKSDVNNDGFYDVYVKLNAIVNGKADLVIKYIQEEVPPETVAAEEPAKEVIPPVESSKEINLVWLWVVIAVIIIVIVIWWAYNRRR